MQCRATKYVPGGRLALRPVSAIVECSVVLLTGSRVRVRWLRCVPVTMFGGGTSRDSTHSTSPGAVSLTVFFTAAVPFATSRLWNFVVICAWTGAVGVLVFDAGTSKLVPEEADADTVGPAGPGAPRGSCPALKSCFSSDPLITLPVP